MPVFTRSCSQGESVSSHEKAASVPSAGTPISSSRAMYCSMPLSTTPPKFTSAYSGTSTRMCPVSIAQNTPTA